MILILTCAEDKTADRVIEGLEKRRASFSRFDPGDFPAAAEITVRYSPRGESAYALCFGGQVVDLKTVRVGWYRRPKQPAAHPHVVDDAVREGIAEDCSAFLNDLWQSLDCAWVPGPLLVLRRAELKGLQLKTAGRLGFELPPTVVTNGPDELLELYRSHHGHLVSKRVASRPWRRWNYEVRYSEPVGTRDIQNARSVRLCPVIFQAYVPKSVEIRVTVVGDRVFAAEIHSQETNRTRHDWRRYDLENTRHARHALPDEVADRCLRLVEALGLCYGAIDLVLTPDGRYVFLEINPNGQYQWIEELAGLPISDAICDLLVSRAFAPDESTVLHSRR